MQTYRPNIGVEVALKNHFKNCYCSPPPPHRLKLNKQLNKQSMICIYSSSGGKIHPQKY